MTHQSKVQELMEEEYSTIEAMVAHDNRGILKTSESRRRKVRKYLRENWENHVNLGDHTGFRVDWGSLEILVSYKDKAPKIYNLVDELKKLNVYDEMTMSTSGGW